MATPQNSLNDCLKGLHQGDQELATCKSYAETETKLAVEALGERDEAILGAAKASNSIFLGIPPTGWLAIGFIAGGASIYALTRR